MTGPRSSQSGAGGIKEVTNSFLRPPVSLPPTLGSHDSEFSFAVFGSEAPWTQAVRVPDRASLENWRAGAGRW